jgi:hypothetical protein
VNAVVLILLAGMFLAGVLAGMLALLVAGIRSDDRRRNIHLAPGTHAQVASRRLLVNIREVRSESTEDEEDR